MEPREVLNFHLEICEAVHALLLEENSWLKSKKAAPEQELLERKQALLPQLDESLARLKRLQPELFSPFDDSKKLINDAHSKLLQIFYVDRENEDLLLKLTHAPSGERESFNRFAEPKEIDDLRDQVSPPEGAPENASGDAPPPPPPDQGPGLTPPSRG